MSNNIYTLEDRRARMSESFRNTEVVNQRGWKKPTFAETQDLYEKTRRWVTWDNLGYLKITMFVDREEQRYPFRMSHVNVAAKLDGYNKLLKYNGPFSRNPAKNFLTGLPAYFPPDQTDLNRFYSSYKEYWQSINEDFPGYFQIGKLGINSSESKTRKFLSPWSVIACLNHPENPGQLILQLDLQGLEGFKCEFDIHDRRPMPRGPSARSRKQYDVLEHVYKRDVEVY